MLTLFCRHVVRWRWGYALVASGILFLLSSYPIRQPRFFRHIDKVEHAIAYLLLSLAYYNVASGGGRRGGWGIALGVWLAAVAFGISDEWHQTYVPGRSGEIADVLADAAGSAVGVGLALALHKAFARRAGSDPAGSGTRSD
jgi:VanZ family protein